MWAAMSTYDADTQFLNEFKRLSPQQQALFLATRDQMVADLKAGRPFHPKLRVKGVQGHSGVFEMTWEMHNGSATFHYGPPRHPGDVHIHWRRIGDHNIFKQP